ncbi:MAG: TonB-dependent receptor [Zoogloeaceae bacterium]|jgi:vitamin B12 transporter|nr:TonB-dependent receptor [Zoogloeaceae bacterium]
MSSVIHPPSSKALAALFLPSILLTPAFAQQSGDENKTLETIVVTATRQATRASELLADVTVIDRAAIEKSGQDTITELLARQSGIQATTTGGPGTQTSFFVRGANHPQTKIIVDGIAINTANGDSPLRFLSLDSVERIEILRGPASALYGADAIGGVIHIITRRGQPGLAADGFVGYGSHDTQKANAGISGGDEHWRFRVEANHYQTNGFSAQRHARNKDADDDAYRNIGGAASFSFLPAQGHELGLIYRRNKGLVNYDSGNTPPTGDYDNRSRFETEQWQLFSRNRVLENWESTLRYGESENDYMDYSWNAWAFPPAESISKTHTRNQQLGWQNDLTLPLGKAILAVEKEKQRIGPRRDDSGANPYPDHAPEISNTSFLGGWTAHVDKHGWQVNARRDRHSEFGGKTTWGAAYGYQLTDALRAHVRYGTAFRAPTVIDLFRPGWGGNPDLKPEEAKNSEIGVVWEQGAHRASALYYRNRVKNLIAYMCDALWNCKNENVNKALLEGVTLAYAGQFGAWRLEAAYDWLNAENKSRDANGIGYERLARRARDKATLNLTHTWGKLETGVEVIGVGRRYDNNYLKTAANKEELGGYGLTNLTARYALNKNLTLEGRLNNIFDKQYEQVRGYGTDGFNAFVGLHYSGF